jgi:hypothetical protein
LRLFLIGLLLIKDIVFLRLKTAPLREKAAAAPAVVGGIVLH